MADVAIIGAGPGGYVAALRASQLGLQAVLIERDKVGGVCLNRGCIPSKALLRSVEVYQLARRAGRFGVSVSDAQLDWGSVRARKQRIVDGLVEGVERLLSRAGIEVVRAEARFVSPTALETHDGRRIAAGHFVVATGSRPARPPIPGLDLPGVIDSRAALDLTALPESVCIIGGGAIGVEFATLFAGAGVRVTLVEMLPQLLPAMDQSLGQSVQSVLERRRVRVMTGTRVARIEQAGDQLAVAVQTDARDDRIQAGKVLCAVGRRPNVHGLGLDAAGVDYEASGIVVDEQMCTNVPAIYAIGDVAQGRWLLAHVASQEGTVAVENVAGQSSRMRYQAIPACVFSSPEAASVGLSEEEAREQHGDSVRVGTSDLRGSGKSLAYGESEGFVKIVSEAKYGQVLGVHAMGPHASELIVEAAMAITLEATIEELVATIHPHPTFSEAMAEAARAVRGRAIHSLRSYR